ncbi:MAG TPA: serine protease [Terriglobales bacterium]|jgi:Trypsin-like peptidase domain|nr:serine protease [Terriglobales bacterium]
MGRKWFRVAVLVLCAAAVTRTNAKCEVLDKIFLNSTVLISYPVTTPPSGKAGNTTGDKNRKVLGVMNGTGFLLFSDVGVTKTHVYLITNRHVLPPEGAKKNIQLRVVIQEQDGSAKIEEISVPVVGDDGKYLPAVSLHRDPTTDVAAVNIGSSALGAKFTLLTEAVKTGRYLSTSMLLPTSSMAAQGVGVGSQVYILGYPAAIFDPRNVSPVLRVGVISTDPLEGFNFNEELRRTMHFPEHMDGFLLDANIYPGSSGSLVVSTPESTNCNQAEKQRTYILGIVSGSIPIFDASLNSYSRIGLGMVYSADTIRQVLNGFLNR